MKRRSLHALKYASRPLALLLGLAVVCGLAWAVVYTWLLADLPPVSSIEARLVRPTTRILDRDGRLLYEVLDPNAGKQIDLSLSSIPQTCIQATLATEDSRFYWHPGVDPIAIARAAWQNYRAGGQVVSGGSTLTQQLARSLLLGPEERFRRSYVRKLREAWLALQLEWRYSKDELLALYLNQTYYGHFAFGIEAAAQNFFAKPAEQLSRAECALLVGLGQYPSGYDPLRYPAAAKTRQLTVLRLMADEGYLTASEVAQLAAEPLRYRSRLFDIQAPHFVIYVQDLLVDQVGVDRLREGGLEVVTTLDLPLQHQAQAIVRRRLDQLNCRSAGADGRSMSGSFCDGTTDPNRRVDNAAAVVLDSRTGHILAMVGSPDYFDERIQGNVNAALSLRQPGSAIKPLTYAAALDPAWSAALGLSPLTPASVIADLPTSFMDERQETSEDQLATRHPPPATRHSPSAPRPVPYVPANNDRRYHGPVTVREALANSLNIPAVKVLDRVGVETLRHIATQAGISSFTGKYGLALTLGGGEVSLLELATAYGMFANQGYQLEPVAILEIRGAENEWRVASGESIPITRHPHTTRSPGVISPATAYLVTDILSDPVARIPAFGEGSVLDLPFPAAAKTGTTTDWRDNWTIGYSTRRVVGVWVGNADNAPMYDVSGIDGAGPIWHDIMLVAHSATPPPFPRPTGIVELTVCAPSGLLPTPDCPRLRRERFIAGTEPTRPDDQFRRIAVDLATGLRATADTPPLRVQERVYWLLGPEYAAWMEAQGIPQPPPTRAEIGEWRVEADDVERDALPSHARLLVLTGPTSNTAYRIHPGVPRDRQRIPVGGYTADGRPWTELWFMVDGVPLFRANHADRLDAWWPLEPGEHRFWLEGRRAGDEDVSRSQEAYVVVEAVNGQ